VDDDPTSGTELGEGAAPRGRKERTRARAVTMASALAAVAAVRPCRCRGRTLAAGCACSILADERELDPRRCGAQSRVWTASPPSAYRQRWPAWSPAGCCVKRPRSADG
jgi:hypothetical protein